MLSRTGNLPGAYFELTNTSPFLQPLLIDPHSVIFNRETSLSHWGLLIKRILFSSTLLIRPSLRVRTMEISPPSGLHARPRSLFLGANGHHDPFLPRIHS